MQVLQISTDWPKKGFSVPAFLAQCLWGSVEFHRPFSFNSVWIRWAISVWKLLCQAKQCLDFVLMWNVEKTLGTKCICSYVYVCTWCILVSTLFYSDPQNRSRQYTTEIKKAILCPFAHAILLWSTKLIAAVHHSKRPYYALLQSLHFVYRLY